MEVNYDNFDEDIFNVDVSLGENADIESYEDEGPDEYERKREQLNKTKITKQTWSIFEIYKKIKDNTVNLSPKYQRNFVWDNDKQTSFIESIFMEITVPPIYLVEIQGKDFLDGTTYEVVDGKQRLTSIYKFMESRLNLNDKALEYFADWYGGKTFNEISLEYPDAIQEFISQVLDMYVITANSPEFTKYDIFSRLNKGSLPLQTDEIRRAVYHSELIDFIDNFIETKVETEIYSKVFSLNDKKRYKDYGFFFQAVAMYINSNSSLNIIENYKSRPREMINDVLEKFQDGDYNIKDFDILNILETALNLQYSMIEVDKSKYIVDAMIKCAVDNPENYQDVLEIAIEDDIILDTLSKSPSTTSQVNKRFSRIKDLFCEVKGDV